MTDIERDQIDNDAQMYMRTCSSAIRTLKTEGKNNIKHMCDAQLLDFLEAKNLLHVFIVWQRYYAGSDQLVLEWSQNFCNAHN